LKLKYEEQLTLSIIKLLATDGAIHLKKKTADRTFSGENFMEKHFLATMQNMHQQKLGLQRKSIDRKVN